MKGENPMRRRAVRSQACVALPVPRLRVGDVGKEGIGDAARATSEDTSRHPSWLPVSLPDGRPVAMAAEVCDGRECDPSLLYPS